jgi:hypothetical protein
MVESSWNTSRKVLINLKYRHHRILGTTDTLNHHSEMITRSSSSLLRSQKRQKKRMRRGSSIEEEEDDDDDEEEDDDDVKVDVWQGRYSILTYNRVLNLISLTNHIHCIIIIIDITCLRYTSRLYSC